MHLRDILQLYSFHATTCRYTLAYHVPHTKCVESLIGQNGEAQLR